MAPQRTSLVADSIRWAYEMGSHSPTFWLCYFSTPPSFSARIFPEDEIEISGQNTIVPMVAPSNFSGQMTIQMLKVWPLNGRHSPFLDGKGRL